MKKVIEINPYLLGTMAGGAGEPFSFIVTDLSSTDLTFVCAVQRIVSIGKRILGFSADSTS